MKLTLPKPPSVNQIYGLSNRGAFARSYITKAGVDWFATAGELLKKQIRNRKPIETEVEIWIDLFTSRDQDIDNILKPTLDLLAGWCLKCHTKFSSRKDCTCKQNFSVIANDRQVIKLDVEKFKVKKDEEHITVEILGF